MTEHIFDVLDTNADLKVEDGNGGLFHFKPSVQCRLLADTVAKVVLQKVSKIPKAAGAAFV